MIYNTYAFTSAQRQISLRKRTECLLPRILAIRTAKHRLTNDSCVKRTRSRRLASTLKRTKLKPKIEKKRTKTYLKSRNTGLTWLTVGI